MNNPYTGAVAAGLRKCQLLLESEQEGVLQRASLQEAAIFQLWRAYQAFLCELAFQLRLGAEPQSATELADLAAARGIPCTEAAELLELQKDPQSWLAQLQASWQQLWKFSADQESGKVESSQLISVKDLSVPEPQQLSNELLQIWRLALTELVWRQRAQAEEW